MVYSCRHGGRHERDGSRDGRHRLHRRLVHRRTAGARLRGPHDGAQSVEGSGGAGDRPGRGEPPDRRHGRPYEGRGLGRGGRRLRLCASRRFPARRRHVPGCECPDRARPRRDVAGASRGNERRREAGGDDVSGRHGAPTALFGPCQRRNDLGRSRRSPVRRLPCVEDPRGARRLGFRDRRHISDDARRPFFPAPCSAPC